MISDLPKFLNDFAIEVSHWVNEGKIDMEDLPYILRAYQGENIEESADELLQELESYAVKYFKSMTANQAANLIINHGNYMKNAELVEICEKLVVHGYN